MDQTLNTGLDLNECAVVGDDDNLTLHVVTHLEVRIERIPRMRSELLQAERNALLLLIEVEDNDIDLLVELYNLMRIADAAPREVGDMHQSVHTAEVDEYTVRGDVFDSTLEHLTLLQVRDDLFLLSFELGLDECFVRYDDIAELLVDLHHLELHGLAHEHVVVAYRMNVNLAAGEEGLDAEDIDDHTTLCAALDVALDHLIVLHSLVDELPALAQASLLVRKYQLTLLVLLVLDIDFHLVANLQVGVVAELRSGDDTIALVADVDYHLFLIDGDDSTLDHLVLLDLVESLVVGLLEVLLANV